jgi:hypothetical protein
MEASGASAGAGLLISYMDVLPVPVSLVAFFDFSSIFIVKLAILLGRTLFSTTS